ncbi:antirestriction Ral family protein [Escherichia coli]
MTTTIDKNQWCGQFKRCNGCKLQVMTPTY